MIFNIALYKQMREISNLNHNLLKKDYSIKLIKLLKPSFDKTKPLQITNDYRLCKRLGQ